MNIKNSNVISTIHIGRIFLWYEFLWKDIINSSLNHMLIDEYLRRDCIMTNIFYLKIQYEYTIMQCIKYVKILWYYHKPKYTVTTLSSKQNPFILTNFINHGYKIKLIKIIRDNNLDITWYIQHKSYKLISISLNVRFDEQIHTQLRQISYINKQLSLLLIIKQI